MICTHWGVQQQNALESQTHDEGKYILLFHLGATSASYFWFSFLRLNEFWVPLMVHIKLGRNIVLSRKIQHFHCLLELVNIILWSTLFHVLVFSVMSKVRFTGYLFFPGLESGLIHGCRCSPSPELPLLHACFYWLFQVSTCLNVHVKLEVESCTTFLFASCVNAPIFQIHCFELVTFSDFGRMVQFTTPFFSLKLVEFEILFS